MRAKREPVDNVAALIDQLAGQLQDWLRSNHISEPVIIGIHTGGIWIAEHLRDKLKIAAPLGHLNIAFYRDDFSQIGMHPHVTPSKLPFEVDGQHIILVDDVLYTGRTIRAAMNEIFDFGRPASICLAVLIDRSGRELPIQAQAVGKTLKLKPEEHVKLSGPEPLALEITANA
ncbi:MAG: Uracil phosphoribosyltransferase [Gammaproteobacteria bacterium]|nr:Uracil phosphoribosyltransferase [Gammaproteobacteria bacterium]